MQVDVPVFSSISVIALVLTLAVLVAVFRFKLGTLTVIAAAAVAGVLIWTAPQVLGSVLTRSTCRLLIAGGLVACILEPTFDRRRDNALSFTLDEQ